MSGARPFVTPATGWHDKDQLDARSEGWGIFDTGTRLEIQRVDEVGLLESDDAARALVLGMAQNGMRLQRKAVLHILTQNGPWVVNARAKMARK